MASVVDLELPISALGMAGALERVPTLTGTIVGQSLPETPLVRIQSHDVGTITPALERDDSVTVRHELSSGPDAPLYRLDFGHSLSLFLHIISSHGGTLLEMSLQNGCWLARLVFADRPALAHAYRRLEEYEFEPQVARITSLEAINDPGIAWLTETQAETLEMAHEHGYFEVPRQVTLEELAEKLGVTHQALSERLRRSHAALLSSQLASSTGHWRVDPE